MTRWDERTRWLITAAAVVPIILSVLTDDESPLTVAVDLVSWGVFVVDLVVRNSIQRRYVLTGAGLFDLSIVLLTFPWYLLPGAGNTQFMALFRLARLLRLIGTPHNRALGRQIAHKLGGLGIFIAVASLVSSLIVLNVEPAESGYENFGDALWWAIVTFTTVGYGDLFPVTAPGRLAGVLMLLTGLAALGSVASVLTSVIASGEEAERAEAESAEAEKPPLDPTLASELRSLRDEVAELTELVRRGRG